MNIEPIKLLKGSHDDTGTTGQGCFMNVIEPTSMASRRLPTNRLAFAAPFARWQSS